MARPDDAACAKLVGTRPWATGAFLRSLVAPRLLHHGDQRRSVVWLENVGPGS